jgi:transcription termination factor NusB
MKNEEITRNKAQELSLAAIYASLTYLDMKETIDVEAIVSGICDKPYADCDPYVKGAVIQSLKHLNEIVPIFDAHMQHWTFARLNRLEQALLLLSYVHYFYLENSVDKGVVIDVAVKLAKLYLDSLDYKFVNAILDKVLTRG